MSLDTDRRPARRRFQHRVVAGHRAHSLLRVNLRWRAAPDRVGRLRVLDGKQLGVGDRERFIVTAESFRAKQGRGVRVQGG